MSNNNTRSNERTPLIGGHDGTAEINGTDETPKSERLHNWLSRHVLSIILSILLLLFIALFLVNTLLKSPLPGSHPGNHKSTVCTAAGCVLASSTLLRSISPRSVTLKAPH